MIALGTYSNLKQDTSSENDIEDAQNNLQRNDTNINLANLYKILLHSRHLSSNLSIREGEISLQSLYDSMKVS